MKKIFMLFSVMCVALMASAQTDHIEVAELKLAPGEEGKLVISLINPERDYTQFNLDVELPEGLSFCQYKVGRNQVWGEVSGDRTNDHGLSAAQPGEDPQVKRFLVESPTNSNFYNEDEDGNPASEILLVGVKADEDVELGTTLTVKVTKVNFTALENGKGVNYELADAKASVTVSTAAYDNALEAANADMELLETLQSELNEAVPQEDYEYLSEEDIAYITWLGNEERYTDIANAFQTAIETGEYVSPLDAEAIREAIAKIKANLEAAKAGATGISSVSNEAVNGKIYNLNGTSVKVATNGVYIINGKKIVSVK